MFWRFVAASAVAIGLIQLGAMSVWLSVLKAILAGVLARGLAFVWRRYRGL